MSHDATSSSSFPIAAVMIHVGDVAQALAWYRSAFPGAASVTPPDGFECLRIGTVQLELVPADGKVAAGAAGSVVYWQVADFDAALRRFQALGAVLHRGPMVIDEGVQVMCQVRDPWGNCIGLRGPAPAADLPAP